MSAGAVTRRRPVAGRAGLADREGFLAKLFLLPAVIYIVALVAVPLVVAIAFAFSDVTVGDPSFDWAGFRNFDAIFDDPVFWRALRNTLIFTVISMTLVIVFANILALILIQNFRFKWLIRFLVLLPWTTPVALGAVSWLWLLDSVYSPIDWAMRQLGLIQSNVYWLGKDDLAMASVIAVHTWRIVPLAAVIILAGLISIPDDINDAAEMDGAGFWRKTWEITVPLTLPVVAVAALFGAVLTFTDMSVVYILTRGGPENATQVLPSYAFIKGISGGDLAQGAAIAVFLFPLMLAAAIAILRAVKRMETF